MSPATTAVAAALVASAALNVYLLADHEQSAPARSSDSETPPTPIASPADQVVVGSLDDVRLGCHRMLAVCREERASLDRELDSRRPPNEKFDEAAPGTADPEREAQLASVVDRVLGDLDHNVECREQVCRIEVVAPADAERDWLRSIQSDGELRALAERVAVEAARPTTDPMTGEGLLAHRLFVGLNDRDAISGSRFLEELIAELESSGAIERCARDHPDDAGTLSYRLRTGEGRVALDLGGDLYATDAGRCIAGAQSRIAAAATLPPKLTRAVVYNHITLPLNPI